MTFEVVRLGLTHAYLNYSVGEVRQLGGSGDMLPQEYLDFRPSEVVSDVIFE